MSFDDVAEQSQRLVARPLRLATEPLGMYVRPSSLDHRFLADYVVEANARGLKGVVFDASLDELQANLRVEIQNRGIPSVIDFRVMELATEGGFQAVARRLPWAAKRLDSPGDFSPFRVRALVAALTAWVVEREFSAVLAPTHFLANGERDPWLRIDLDVLHRLRDALDAAGANRTLIYYPLAVRPESFFHVVERDKLRIVLSQAPIDELWLRVHRIGSNSGAQSLRRYTRTCAEFHQSGRPIVSENCGIAGLVMLGFGAVGALAGGITSGDQFEFNRLKRARDEGESGFAAPRVYISELQSFLSSKRASSFFAKRLAQSYYACKNDACCKNGLQDMLGNPRRHFLNTRLNEIARISSFPEASRPDGYMDEFLRPATNMLVKAANAEPALQKVLSRLDSWEGTFNAVLMDDRPTTFSPPPNGRRILFRRGA